MTDICKVFPGGDQPVRYSSEDTWCTEVYEEEDTCMRYCDPPRSNTDTTDNSRCITLPQPTQSMTKPLSVEIDPVSFSYGLSSCIKVISYSMVKRNFNYS